MVQLDGIWPEGTVGWQIRFDLMAYGPMVRFDGWPGKINSRRNLLCIQ